MGRGNKSLLGGGGLGHMTKMAATPIYGKYPLKIFFGTKGAMTLVCSIGDMGPTKFVQMMTIGSPWPFLRQCQITSFCFFYGKIYILLGKMLESHLMEEPGVVTRSEACSFGMQMAPSSIPTSGTFFHGDLVMKTFLRPFSLFCWFKKSSCQLLAKECALSTGKLPRRLARNSVVRLTDYTQNYLKCVEGP